jgi:hypothetical protein
MYGYLPNDQRHSSISDLDGKCVTTGRGPYELDYYYIEDYMDGCKDNMNLCFAEELRREISPYNSYVNDEKAGNIDYLPYSLDRIDPSISYNLMIIPSEGKVTPENPYGDTIPANYFCKFTFDLDWT